MLAMLDNLRRLITATPMNVTPVPGDRTRDGAIYAGISPHTRKPFYLQPKDVTCTTWKQATELAATSRVGGHRWRLPTLEELDAIRCYREAIGGFTDGLYWSSDEFDEIEAWSMSVVNSLRWSAGKKHFFYRVRLVRD